MNPWPRALLSLSHLCRRHRLVWPPLMGLRLHLLPQHPPCRSQISTKQVCGRKHSASCNTSTACLFIYAPLCTGGGGDPRSLEIEIRRLNSELKSIKSSKLEQESSIRAQNDRILKLTAKCASTCCNCSHLIPDDLFRFDTLSSVTREALLRRSSTLPPVAVGDTSQYSSLRLKFIEHEQRLYLPIECFDLLEREIFALRQVTTAP